MRVIPENKKAPRLSGSAGHGIPKWVTGDPDSLAFFKVVASGRGKFIHRTHMGVQHAI
jgi:hypothetical protein